MAFGLLVVLAVPAWASAHSAGSIMKEKARGFQNVGRTGEEPAAPPANNAKTGQPAKPRPGQLAMVKPPDLQLSAGQKECAKKLLGALEAIKPGSVASSQQVQALIKEMLSAAQGPAKPPFNSALKLSSSLATGWSSQKMEPESKELLAKNLVFLLNSSARTDNQTGKALEHSETLLKFSGMKGSEADKIVADLKAVVEQIHQ